MQTSAGGNYQRVLQYRIQVQFGKLKFVLQKKDTVTRTLQLIVLMLWFVSLLLLYYHCQDNVMKDFCKFKTKQLFPQRQILGLRVCDMGGNGFARPLFFSLCSHLLAPLAAHLEMIQN